MIPSRAVQAVSMGPVATRAMCPGVELVVHAVFTSALHLQRKGTQDFVALVGPRSGVRPHAVELARPEEFPRWGTSRGAAARCTGDVLQLASAAGPILVELAGAQRLPRRTLPSIPSSGACRAACARRLAELQAGASADLRPGPPSGEASPPAPLGARLTAAARALAAASADPEALSRATAALLDLGAEPAPAGHDFLAGYLAGAHASGRPALADALGRAIERGVGQARTVSAFALRCAIAGDWPGPLVDLAEALAADREPQALAAIEALSAVAEGAGVELAAGMLFALR